MTDRQRAILEFIKRYHARHGYAPTRLEIGKACKFSTSMVNYYLAALHAEGRLTVTRFVSRGIVLNEEAPSDAEWAVMNKTVAR